MVGMAIGLAILTAYGSTTIDRLYDQVYATADAYLQFIPAALRDRPLRDGLVVEALEQVGGRRGGADHGRDLPRGGRGDRRRVPPALLLDRRRRSLAADGGGDPVDEPGDRHALDPAAHA